MVTRWMLGSEPAFDKFDDWVPCMEEHPKGEFIKEKDLERFLNSARKIVVSHFLTPDVRELRDALRDLGVDTSRKAMEQQVMPWDKATLRDTSKPNRDKVLWRTKDGEHLDIDEMSETHVRNCLKMIVLARRRVREMPVTDVYPDWDDLDDTGPFRDPDMF